MPHSVAPGYVSASTARASSTRLTSSALAMPRTVSQPGTDWASSIRASEPVVRPA